MQDVWDQTLLLCDFNNIVLNYVVFLILRSFNKLRRWGAFGFPESKKPGVSQLPELAKLLKVPSVFE